MPAKKPGTTGKKASAGQSKIGTVSYDQKTKTTSVSIGPGMPVPEERFYADYIVIEPMEFGFRLVAIQVHPWTHKPTSAIQLVMDNAAFEHIQSLLAGVAESLWAAAPDKLELPFRFEEVSIDWTGRATTINLATNSAGIAADFYSIDTMSLLMLERGQIKSAKLVPEVRIETLPGRFNHIVPEPAD